MISEQQLFLAYSAISSCSGVIWDDHREPPVRLYQTDAVIVFLASILRLIIHHEPQGKENGALYSWKET